ncbi:MAG: DUF3754 domain-containing protein [Gemmataceae bacterium]|nr:DUF3754 domain-containing protein [Gemmataceae bacterium]
MAEYQDREHYIPIRKSDLVELLCRGLAPKDADPFRQLSTLLAATFHFEYHHLLEELKNEYAPFNPDATTKTLRQLSQQERLEQLEHLFNRFVTLMERANFKRLGPQDFQKATKEVTEWGLNMDVDFGIFEKLAGFARGEYTAERSRRLWWKLWKKESIRMAVYQRLVLMVKLKPSKRLPRTVDTKDVFLKIFKDIPRMDAEMLLPGARMRMPNSSRLKLGGSFLGGLALITWKIVTELTAVIAGGIMFFWGPLLAVLGYGYRQYFGYQSTKNAVNLQLTTNLYYQNLDNNSGVLTHLLDEAEEQESREALLGYFYLWRYAGTQGWTASSLDDYVELELEKLANIKVDFEIEDALAKLERLHLVTKHGDRYAAVPIDRALENLDYAWDNYFKYNNEAQERKDQALAQRV